MKEEIKENIQKLPRLTKEEIAFFLRKDAEFFKHFNLQWPLWRKIASALQTLATAKLVGKGWQGIDARNEREAVEHHLKACLYDPEITNKYPKFRKMAGLPVCRINP